MLRSTDGTDEALPNDNTGNFEEKTVIPICGAGEKRRGRPEAAGGLEGNFGALLACYWRTGVL